MTDPREACANERQRLGWALVHDGLAHPLMVLTGYSKLSLRFHDWTSNKAWPRQETEHKPLYGGPGSMVIRTFERAFAERIASGWRMHGIPFVWTSEPNYDSDGELFYVYQLERLQ